MSVFNFDSLHGLIISWNIKKRQEKIAQILLEKNADIIALQEIHTYFVLSLLKKRLNYPHVAYKKFVYGPRGGLVVFSKHPFVAVDYINFKRRGSLLNSSFIARVIRNGILVCKMEDYPLTILNTHATPNLDHDDSESNRFVKYIESQLEQIAKLSNMITEKGQKILIAGDFNVAKDSFAYKKFLQISGLKDVFAKYDTPTQHQEYLPKNKIVKRIDYIFTGGSQKDARVVSVAQVFTDKYHLTDDLTQYLSDHVGLHAKLKFGSN